MHEIRILSPLTLPAPRSVAKLARQADEGGTDGVIAWPAADVPLGELTATITELAERIAVPVAVGVWQAAPAVAAALKDAGATQLVLPVEAGWDQASVQAAVERCGGPHVAVHAAVRQLPPPPTTARRAGRWHCREWPPAPGPR